MADRMTPEQRHQCMSRIRAKNTRPELIVRKYLFSRGFRYRLYNKRLPGKPDIILRKYRTVIFVNGCFWHGHEGCRFFRLPNTNFDFWRHKIELNQARDLRERIDLRNLGWHVIQIWECQLKPKEQKETLKSLEDTLYHIFLADKKINNHKIIQYPTKEFDVQMVAENQETAIE
ncbi:MAG: DNA mismatch endonuclease Vsr [Bacteroidaceae bacterium]|nr:DNA mismatch endonuclease Vsr [Bacteroidaceae bacterium]